MKQVINLYRKHKDTVDSYTINSIKNEKEPYIDDAAAILKKHRFIELIYEVDESYHQTSSVICRKNCDPSNIGSDKSHYFTKLKLDGAGYYISNPYIHYRTGKASVSLVKSSDGRYTVFDCDLILLLEELRLIDYNSIHEKFKQGIYVLAASLLTLISIALILYGAYVLLTILFITETLDFFHDIFKSIIAITLGIAIFDLAKQIIEHEVLFRSFSHGEDRQYKILGKFLISIVIALSIETLMVVFKITLDDYSKMLSAFYLLIGTTVMFVGLAYFYKTVCQSSRPNE